MFPAADLPADQSGGLKHPQLAGDSGEGHRQWLGQVADAGLAAAQRSQQRPARRVGEGGVGTIEDSIFKHSVHYTGGYDIQHLR